MKESEDAAPVTRPIREKAPLKMPSTENTGIALPKADRSAKSDNVGRPEIETIVSEAACEHGLPVELIQAIIKVESGGNRYAVSPSGAKGLMQLMDTTAQDMGVRDSFDPAQNISGGVRYMRKLLDKFDGDLELALAAYNAGPGAVERHGGVPPYRETELYVSKVLSSMKADGDKVIDRIYRH